MQARMMGLWLLLLAVLGPGLALAAPTQVPYVGHLAHQDGTPFNGMIAVEAALYGQAEGGAAVWGPATLAGTGGDGLTVLDGLLAFTLGADGSAPVEATLLADHPDGLWLAVTIVEDPAGAAKSTPLTPRRPLLSAPYALQAADAQSLGGVDASKYATLTALATVGTSGAYGDLSGTPDLTVYAKTADLADVAFSGDYGALANAPVLATVATSGSYSDLTDRPALPDLTPFLKADGTVALAGPWNLGGQPLSNVVIGTSAQAPATPAAGQLWWDGGNHTLVAWTGTRWASLVEPTNPAAATDLACTGCVAETELGFTLAAVAKSGAYDDLTGIPGTFVPAAHTQGWDTITGKPATYPPEAHTQDWSTVTNKPTTFTPATHGHPWGDLTGVPAGLSDGDNDLLAGLSCADGKVVKRASGAWGCGDDVDTNTTYSGADFAVSLQACDTGKVAVAIDVAGHLVCEVAGGPLPADGLAQVSNGTLTNLLDGTGAAAGLPVNIGTTHDVTVALADAGTLRDLTVTVGFSHPYCPEVEVRLLPPGDATGVRLVKPGGATGTNCTYSHVFHWDDALPDGGALSGWAGRGQAGTWTLRVSDTLINGNEGTGQVTGFNLVSEWLSTAEVRATGDVSVAGDLTAEGALLACGGNLCNLLSGKADATAVDATLTAQAASIAALQAELWCLKQCDPQRIGDCKDRVCNGTTHVCTQSGSLPDGTACQGGAGRCKTGTCCIPTTCYVLGAACGTIDDGCGGVLSCGTCQAAGAVCLNNQCCQPKTCSDLGAECGTWDDQCGGTISCGACGADHTCSGAGACQWNGTTCTGTTCPTMAGYTLSCNPKGLCEYANTDQTGWKAWDTWIWIPAGSFSMGSPGGETGRGTDEGPVHTVTFSSGYYIGKYEVTTATYAACQGASPGTCTAPSTADWDGAGWGTNTTTGRSDHPQNGLTWDQASAVCTWLGGRLPSEAQWEYAATGPTHKVYPWGDTPAPSCAANVAVYDEDASGGRPWACDSCTTSGCSGTKPAGSKAAGAAWSGALDMAGNVWEWCQDWYHSDYTSAPADGSAWVSPTGSRRVLRGGGFSIAASNLRSAYRNDGTPGAHYAHYGVRCLRP